MVESNIAVLSTRSVVSHIINYKLLCRRLASFSNSPQPYLKPLWCQSWQRKQIGLFSFFIYTFTPKRYPANAVNPIATVPQKVILIIAFVTPEPPVFAASAPKTTRKKSANP